MFVKNPGLPKSKVGHEDINHDPFAFDVVTQQPQQEHSDDSESVEIGGGWLEGEMG